MTGRVESSLEPPDPKEQLLKLLKTIPQRDASGELEYLVINGFAVSLATGVHRPHTDVDIVVFGDQKKFEGFGIDCFTPEDYLAGMKLNPEFLKTAAQTTNMRIAKQEPVDVEIIHPGIILVQKITSYEYAGQSFPRNPKDEIEVRTLMNYWQEQPNPALWIPVMRSALQSLPHKRQPRTSEALKRTSDEIVISRKFRTPHSALRVN